MDARDLLTLYRLRYFKVQREKLAERAAALREELSSIEADQRATTAILYALLGPDDTAPAHVLFVDGAARGHARSAAAGYVLVDPASGASKEGAKALGPLSSNEAEVAALILGLEAALTAGIGRLDVRSDSEVVVHAMRGEHTIRARNLRLLYERAVQLASRFDAIDFTHIPRELNRRADALASGVLTKAARRAA